MRCNNQSSILFGMTLEQLKEALAAAQQAYIELMTGGRAISFSYAQGDGTKSVTYEKMDMSQLMMFIKMLQAALGISACRRRAIGFYYA